MGMSDEEFTQLRSQVDEVFGDVELTNEPTKADQTVFTMQLPRLYCSCTNPDDPEAQFAASGNGFTVELTPERVAELRAEGATTQTIMLELLGRYGVGLLLRMHNALDEAPQLYVAPTTWKWGPDATEE